jgi:site-specific DNA-methyltransferase (adenine-specific)
MATLTLHHGDCLELMKTLPDKSIDLFVCDLPYGCLGPVKGGGPSLRDPERPANKVRQIPNVANNHRKACPPTDRGERTLSDGTIAPAGVLGGCKWDIPIDLAAFWVEVKRLCKNDHTPVLMFCTTKFGFELIKSNENWFRYDLVWSKTSAVGFLLANKMPMRSHEMIYVFSKKGANYTRVDIEGDFAEWSVGKNGVRSGNFADAGMPKQNIHGGQGKRCPVSVINMKSARSNQKGEKKEHKHPTQKPDDLYEWLITRYSKEGDTILDPTAGSFASCFTAQKLGRNAIGIEKDDGFYNKAKSLAGV